MRENGSFTGAQLDFGFISGHISYEPVGKIPFETYRLKAIKYMTEHEPIIQPESGSQLTLDQIEPADNARPTSPSDLTSRINRALEAKISRRDLLTAGGILGAAIVINSVKNGLFPFENQISHIFQNPEQTQNNGTNASNPENYHIGEGQPRSGKMVLANNEEDLRMEMGALLNYVPDGPITYWTTRQGRRRYLITGGDTNARMGWTKNSTFMVETNGKTPLVDLIANKQISQSDISQVFGYDSNVTYRHDYAGITSVLQDPGNADHLFGTVHGEQRVTLDAGDSYLATVGLVESTDGGKTWNDKGPFIVGTDPHTPGGIGKYGIPRVSGAGQPTSIYNPADGFAYFAWTDWSFNYNHPDQIYGARAKFDGNLGQLEYWTENGYSPNFNNLKPIIPLPSNDFVFTALPKLSWKTDLNQFHCEGVCDLGFFEAYSQDLANWTTPRINLSFSEPHLYTDPNITSNPMASPDLVVSAPNSKLPVGQPWIYYPTPLSEQYPSSAIIGSEGKLYHSIGDNIIPAELAVVNFTTTS